MNNNPQKEDVSSENISGNGFWALLLVFTQQAL
jgi:hypothetical protein